MEHAKWAKGLCQYNGIYARGLASMAVAAWE